MLTRTYSPGQFTETQNSLVGEVTNMNLHKEKYVTSSFHCGGRHTQILWQHTSNINSAWDKLFTSGSVGPDYEEILFFCKNSIDQSTLAAC